MPMPAGITTMTRPTGQKFAPSTRAELARHANSATQIAHDPPQAQVIGTRSNTNTPTKFMAVTNARRRTQFEGEMVAAPQL